MAELIPLAQQSLAEAERDRYAASITDFVLRAIAGLAGGLAEVHQLPQRRRGDAFPSRESAGRTASRARSPHLREVSADRNGRLTEPTQK
jgi:hypothetical protein